MSDTKIGVCATGKGPYTRSELVEKINASEKYYWIESINDSVKILLCEDPTANSSKLTKAKKKGIQLVKYTDFNFNEIATTEPKPKTENQTPPPKESKKKIVPNNKKEIESKARIEEEALKAEKLRKRIKEGLLKYENLPKEYTNSIGMDFVLIPPGEYKREDSETPVFITEPFYMGKYPVTQGEWLKITNNPSMGLGHIATDRYPLETIEKKSILQFIIKLVDKESRDYELPTALEWEYAAELTLEFIKKNNSTELSDFAWTKENSENKTHPVGEKKPNSFGLYDMIGNVNEICQDWSVSKRNFLSQYRGGSFKTDEKEALITLDKVEEQEKFGFRLVLRDLEISNEEYKLGEERNRKREEKSHLVKEWQKEEDKRKQELERLPKEYINSIGMEFVLIPAGEYLMGFLPQDSIDNYSIPFYNNEPQLRVIITKPFYMGKYPVTQGEWVALVGHSDAEILLHAISAIMYPNSYNFNEGDRDPFDNANEENCQEFILKLNKLDGKSYRLPSEAEWEFAARGGFTGIPTSESENRLSIYTYGDDPSQLGEYAWFEKNSNGITHPVGQKLPNAFGLYDIMGNVFEVCEGFRISRGGSFDSSEYLKLSYRSNYYNHSGLRLVREDIEFSAEEIQLNNDKIERRRAEVEKKKQEKESATNELEKERKLIFEKFPREYVNSLGMEFVLIPPGEYLMGAVPHDKSANENEIPQHKIKITKPFYIGKYPVTQEEWELLMGNNPSSFKEAGKRAPVDSVSWFDCQEYIKALTQKEGKSYRLPTEAEWEYAARGGGAEQFLNRKDEDKYCIYTNGNDDSQLHDYAWYKRNSDNTTRLVGQKIPNSCGIYDLMGNIREWCEDWSNGNYYDSSPEFDPKGPKKGVKRILRGGFWDSASFLRLSSRESDKPDNKYYGNGFRTVLTEFEFSEEEISLSTKRLEAKKIEREKKIKDEELEWNDILQKSRTIYRSLPKEYTNSLGMEFVLIPPGEFLMGAVPQDKQAWDQEKPQHKVRITKPFYIGKYPVTQEEWELLMRKNPSSFKEAGKRAPVDKVSWFDCQEYIKALTQKEGKSYRLPTEAEWEYAARGGGGEKFLNNRDEDKYCLYTYGNDDSQLHNYAWYLDNSGKTTHPVGEKKPNEWGLYDLMGNVWEWCEDWYDADYYLSLRFIDPKGPDKGERRVLRGGSWLDFAEYCRLSRRNRDDPGDRSNGGGFRLVLLP